MERTDSTTWKATWGPDLYSHLHNMTHLEKNGHCWQVPCEELVPEAESLKLGSILPMGIGEVNAAVGVCKFHLYSTVDQYIDPEGGNQGERIPYSCSQGGANLLREAVYS